MTIAIVAGSYDPISLGHLSVIAEAARLFGHIVVLIANNDSKTYLLTNEERLSTVREATAGIVNCSVDFTEGLVIDYAKRVGATVMVRGMRNQSDSAYELVLAENNRAMMPNLSTVILPAALTGISSSMVKQKFADGEHIGAFVPPGVFKLLKEKIGSKNE